MATAPLTFSAWRARVLTYHPNVEFTTTDGHDTTHAVIQSPGVEFDSVGVFVPGDFCSVNIAGTEHEFGTIGVSAA